MRASARTALTLAALVSGCGEATTTPGDAVVASVSVAPDSVLLAPGGQAAFNATARDADGVLITGRTVSWRVANAAVAGVSTGGTVVGVAAGVTSVTATVDGITGQGAVVVETTAPLSVADDFERSNSELGSQWFDLNDNMEILGGEVGVRVAGSSLAYWTANQFGNDQFSEVVLGSMDAQSYDILRGVQPYVRLQTQGTDWRYGFHYFSDTRTWAIKYDGGPNPQTMILAESAVEPLPEPGDVLRIEAVGTTIRGYVNGQIKLQVTDTLLAGGRLGFVIGPYPGSADIPRRFVAAWSGGER
jgi:hypothetical protein